MKYLLALFILIGLALNSSYAQSDEVLAKSYFLKAEEAYDNNQYSTALSRLDQTVEYLGSTNPRIEALYVRVSLGQSDYQTAKEHLDNYFESADESRSDYMEMLGYAADVHEKTEAPNSEDKTAEKEDDNRSGWQTFDQEMYSIQYPSKWNLALENIGNSDFVISSPDPEKKNENAALRMESADLGNNDISLASYEEIYINGYLKTNFSNLIVHTSNRKRVNSYYYQEVLCSASNENNIELMFLTRIIIHQNRLYILFFATKKSDFDTHRKTVNSVLDSFTLI